MLRSLTAHRSSSSLARAVASSSSSSTSTLSLARPTLLSARRSPPSSSSSSRSLAAATRRSFTMSAPASAAKPMEGVEGQAAQIIDGNQLAKYVASPSQFFFAAALPPAWPTFPPGRAFREFERGANGSRPQPGRPLTDFFLSSVAGTSAPRSRPRLLPSSRPTLASSQTSSSSSAATGPTRRPMSR
jgi:hypothetical protein